ncbi:MAG: helix-turn-helix transcriptional regulator [Bacteroidales bacterium]
MKERIQQIMDREGMTPGRFADSIGIQRSALSHILNGRNNPSLDVMMKVLNRFDYLSTDWLLFGNGPMFKHQLASLPEGNIPTSNTAPESTSVNIGMTDSLTGENTQPAISIPSSIISGNLESKSVKEVVIKEVEKMRTVSRIMIFYSDNTFENFIPETPGKVSKL